MNKTVNLIPKERVLSPKGKKNFEGKLVILDEAVAGLNSYDHGPRPSSGSKNVSKRPPGGSLEVLKPGAATESQAKDSNSSSTRPESGRLEKKLPLLRRKTGEQCSCTDGSNRCPYCLDLESKLKGLEIEGKYLKESDLKTRNCMAPRMPPSQQSFNPVSREAISEGGNDSGESDTSSSDDEDGNDEGNNDNWQHSLSSQTASAAKAPLELLGRFLSALMKKDYKEAQILCNEVLLIEPDNPTCLEFKSTLTEKIEQDEESDSDGSDDEDGEDSDDDDDESGEDSSEEDSGNEDISNDESDNEDVGVIDVSKLNLFVGGVPAMKNSLPR